MAGSGVPESALGHHYQSWWSLHVLLDAGWYDVLAGVRVERLDDVELNAGGAAALMQTKRITGQGTVSGLEFWKALRHWLDIQRIATGVTTQRLCLVTPTALSSSSPLTLLRSLGRDVPTAASLLLQNANKARGKTKRTVEKFIALSSIQRLELLDSVFVIDKAEDLSAIEERIKARLTSFAVDGANAEAAFLELLGWWEKALVAHLKDKSPSARITFTELKTCITRIREKYGIGRVAPDSDVLRMDLPENLDVDVRALIHQLEIIAFESPGVRFALEDFYRAHIQRKRWLERGLVTDDDIEQYENHLVQEWKRYCAFHATRSHCAGKSEAELATIGQQIHNAMIERSSHLTPSISHPTIHRGSLYNLSNTLDIGWHPDFAARVHELLSGKTA